MKKFHDNLLENKAIKIKKNVLFKSTSVWKKILSYILFFFKTTYDLNFNRKKFDFIYFHYLNHSLIPLFFVFNKKYLPRMIFNAHGADLFPETKLSRILAEKTSVHFIHASKIVVPSIYFQKKLIEKYNIEQSKIFVSPSGGVDTNIFFNFDTLKFKRKKTVIGFLGRIEKNKGILLTLDLIKNFSFEELQKIKFLVAGTGSLLEYIKDIIQKDYSNVDIEILGPLDHETIPTFFNSIDLFLFLSNREGESLGLVALEALACGVPIIAFKNGAIEEFLIEEKNGYFLKSYNSTELKDLVLKFDSLEFTKKLTMSEFSNSCVTKYDQAKVSNDIHSMLKTLT